MEKKNTIYTVNIDRKYEEAFRAVADITGMATDKHTLLFLANLYRFDLLPLDLKTKKQMLKIARHKRKANTSVRWAISMKGSEVSDLCIKLAREKMEKEFGVKLTLTGTIRALIFLAVEFLRQKYPAIYEFYKNKP